MALPTVFWPLALLLLLALPSTPAAVWPAWLFAGTQAKTPDNSITTTTVPSSSGADSSSAVGASSDKRSDLYEVEEQFQLWNEALQTGDPERVVDLYAPESVLVPTMSNVVRYDRAGKVDYFKSFLEHKPVGIITEHAAQFLDEQHSSAASSGLYTFNITTAAGKQEQLQARFTFVYTRREGRPGWEIVQHHSSKLPQAVVARLYRQPY